jgi:hypothetical protein
MTTANRIVEASKDAIEAMELAQNGPMQDVDQDWDNETTTWTFQDGSKLVVQNSDFFTG